MLFESFVQEIIFKTKYMLTDDKIDNLKKFNTGELREEVKRRKCQNHRCRDCQHFEGIKYYHSCTGKSEEVWKCTKMKSQGPLEFSRKCQCLRYLFRGKGVKPQLQDEIVD